MFGYLNVFSDYTFLRGVANVDTLIETAKRKKIDAIAITDLNNLHNAISFYKKATEAGIKPIIGTTLFVKHKEIPHYTRVVLLAKNRDGYENIITIITLAQLADNEDVFVELEKLKNLTSGVVAILPPLNNAVSNKLQAKEKTTSLKILNNYKKVFKNLYFGITNQNGTPLYSPEVEDITKEAVKIANENDIPVIPLPLIYLSDKDEIDARDVILKIQRIEKTHLEEDVFVDNLIMPNKKDVENFANTVDKNSLSNLSDLIDSIELDLNSGDWLFPIPDGKNYEKQLRDAVDKGILSKGIEMNNKLRDRIEFEINTIKEKGYLEYFLVVMDLVRFMKEKGILTTTRGSAAGSMVSYLLGIVNIDPIVYGLPFERFLNPFRPSAPDIDIDIADDKRSIVIDYMIKKYGKDKVAQIGTFGTMMARAAVRDTARALGYSYLVGDRIAKLIPLGKQGFPMYINKALNETPELKKLYEADETTKHIIDVAKKIEGNARHISTHAAGVVISPERLTKYTPLQKDERGKESKQITQYDMHAVEYSGLIKFDILGLTNLSILSKSIEYVKNDLGVDVDIDNIEIKNRKTFDLIKSGRTKGLFQLGGDGMSAVLKKMQPENIYDIAATIALYRPGPMSNIDEYIKRKKNEVSITYKHIDMKKYLDKSYGVLVYQDDILFTAIELAGYNWEEVDVFRKAIGKKIPELMASEEKRFKERILERYKNDEKLADGLWELFDPFKGYGFNKAHAISYAKLSYQTAYMKANYPAQYMAAHLFYSFQNVDEVSDLIFESKKIGLKILPANINKSKQNFSAEKYDGDKWGVRMGLQGIKGVGEAIARSIDMERGVGGEFTSLENFLFRISKYKVLNKRGLENLIKVGVFDIFEKRELLLSNLDLLLICLKEETIQKQTSLFEVESSIHLLPTKMQISTLQKLTWEKELLGVYISGHPLDRVEGSKGETIEEIKKLSANKTVKKAVMLISDMKEYKTNKGKMLFLKLEDNKNNKIEAVCFSNSLEENEEYLSKNSMIEIEDAKTRRNKNKDMTLVIEKVKTPTIK